MERGRVKDFMTTILKASNNKSDDEGRGLKIVQNCVTSFSDDSFDTCAVSSFPRKFDQFYVL